MRYIIYIDKLIALIFAFHTLQLVIAKRFFLCTATRRRIILSAVLGTFLFYVLFCVIGGSLLLRVMLGSLVSSLCIIPFCFRRSKKGKWLKLYLLSANGVYVAVSCMMCLAHGSGRAYLFAVMSELLILVFLIGGKRIDYCEKGEKTDQRIVRVSLLGAEETITVYALIDSGNGLYEPISGEPVHLISTQLAEQLGKVFAENSFRIVPYRSVGCQKGYLESYRIPCIRIHSALEDRDVLNPILAITKQGMDENSPYQMILHPDLFLRRTEHVVAGGRKGKRILADYRTK